MPALVQYMSPSSMVAYLTNPMYFKQRYILGVRDMQYSVTGIIGSAAHIALEAIYENMRLGEPISYDEAILLGQKYIDSQSDDKIKYNSKVANRAALAPAYARAINFYTDELPRFHSIVTVEEPIKEEVDSVLHPETKLPIAISVRLDLLVANQQKELEVIDHKFVYNYTDPNRDDYKRFIQAMYYYYAVKQRYGIAPARMRFKECKTSKNKDNSSQIKEWVFDYSDRKHFVIFERLFTDVILDMNNPGKLFLPNPGDAFNGQEMFDAYREDIMPVAAPISVKHRTEEAHFVEKNFAASAGSSVDTAAYTPEEKIRIKLQDFGIPVDMQKTYIGPNIIKYTMLPSRSVKLSTIARMEHDLALVLEAQSIRVEAPIFGTNLVGIEVPNKDRQKVDLTDKHLRPGTLKIPIGVDVFGEVVYKSLADMPHLLIAGQTGAGKSVMINVLLQTLTKQLTPEQLKLILIDPKRVELAQFSKLPHLARPVVYESIQAVEVLDSVVQEMEARYKILEESRVRSIEEYKGNMSRYLVVIDEFADLMITTQKVDVETLDIKKLNQNLEFHIENGSGRLTQKAMRAALKDTMAEGPADAQTSIIRIAQKARAVGIYLVLATQRPSADVVTGLIKANIPTKIAFATTNAINSKIILDEVGAEQLTGKGDMLFMTPGEPLKRLQGLYA